MQKYLKPFLCSFSANKLHEVQGPAQAAYVELQIYYQQIPESEAMLNKVERVMEVAELERPAIFRIDKIA